MPSIAETMDARGHWTVTAQQYPKCFTSCFLSSTYKLDILTDKKTEAQ